MSYRDGSKAPRDGFGTKATPWPCESCYGPKPKGADRCAECSKPRNKNPSSRAPREAAGAHRIRIAATCLSEGVKALREAAAWDPKLAPAVLEALDALSKEMEVRLGGDTE